MQKIVIGNWKMNGSLQRNKDLIANLKNKLKDLDNDVECVVCPPSIYISQVAELIKNTEIKLGAQDVAYLDINAFTGEISATMFAEFNCKYIIVGHSERRHILGESDDVVADKVRQVLACGLIPILCVGETKQQRAQGQTFETISLQLKNIVDELTESCIIAYEPVWAIGTGESATPEHAQEVHAFIKKQVSFPLRVLYGGSVKPENSAELFAQQDIDGGLIGGASLKAQDFSDICHTAR